jgi:hypothetical protein
MANVCFIAVASSFFGSFHGVHVVRVQGLKRTVHISKEREKGLNQDEGTHSLLN